MKNDSKNAFYKRNSGDPGAPARNDPFLGKGSRHTGIAASICAVSQTSKTDTEALSGAFFFFVLGQTGLFAYGFLRIAKIQPLFCHLGRMPRKHREKSYPQKLSILHCIYCRSIVSFEQKKRSDRTQSG